MRSAFQPLEAGVDVTDEGDPAERGVDRRLIREDQIVIAPKAADPCARPDRNGLRRHDHPGQIAVKF
jgi:hypothetical protein